MTNWFLGTYFTSVLNTSTELNTNSAPTWKQSARIKTFTKSRDQTPQTHIICKYDIYKGVPLSQRPQPSMHTLEKIYAGEYVDQQQVRSFALFLFTPEGSRLLEVSLKMDFHTYLEMYQFLTHYSKVAALPSLRSRSLTPMKGKQGATSYTCAPTGHLCRSILKDTGVSPYGKNKSNC